VAKEMKESVTKGVEEFIEELEHNRAVPDTTHVEIGYVIDRLQVILCGGATMGWLNELRKFWKDAAIVECARQFTNQEETMDSITEWDNEKLDEFLTKFEQGYFTVSDENR
jgi:hypothetical protein